MSAIAPTVTAVPQPSTIDSIFPDVVSVGGRASISSGIPTADQAIAASTPATGTTAVAGANGPGVAPVTGGGGTAANQAVAGNAELGQVLQQLADVLTGLIQVLEGMNLQQQGGVGAAGGGGTNAGTAGCGEGCACCNTAADVTGGGASGAPIAQVSSKENDSHARGAPASAPSGPAAPDAMINNFMSFAKVDPSKVPDGSRSGLTASAITAADDAKRFGMKLISGHRPGATVSGTNSPSDHGHGNAIDMALGKNSSDEMKAYAEYMRENGREGKLNVKYVIFDDKIASAKDGWAWRKYDPKGPVNATTRHLDHVHVSFK